MKYDKQDQQGKAAFSERNPHMTQQQEPVARSIRATSLTPPITGLIGTRGPETHQIFFSIVIENCIALT
jgi:hypothetical protein